MSSNPADPPDSGGSSPPRRSAGSSTMDPLIGQVLLGRYEVLRRIGSGGMGAVYVGRQKAVSRNVALKVLRSDLMANEHVRERFRREAEIIGRLRHPNTIQLIDYGESDDGMAVMVMELLVGQPLNERLKERGTLPLAEALQVGIEVASSLAEAHLIGLVHRDLKPANIFLVEVAGQTHAKVLDFGIARILDEESTRLTSTGQVFGTPRYMSPEQAMSTGEVDHRSDVYALGLIIFECIVGQPPFVAQTSIQYLSAHTAQPPPKLRDQFADAPEPLEALIDACLAKDPAERPQSAEAVAQALEAIRRAVQSGGVVPAVVIPRGTPAAGSAATQPAGGVVHDTLPARGLGTKTTLDPGLKAPPASPAKPPMALIAGVAALVVALAIAAAYLALRPSEAVVLSATDGALVAAQVDAEPPRPPDASLLALVAPLAKDGGSAEETPADAATAEEDLDAGRARRDGGRRGPGPTKQIVVQPGQGDVTVGPRGDLVLQVGETNYATLAKACSSPEVSGPGKLQLERCPKGCAVLVDEKCAGKTPGEFNVPVGFHEIVVVCRGKIARRQQAKFSAEEAVVAGCR